MACAYYNQTTSKVLPTPLLRDVYPWQFGLLLHSESSSLQTKQARPSQLLLDSTCDSYDHNLQGLASISELWLQQHLQALAQ